jgi:hypothetical protein
MKLSPSSSSSPTLPQKPLNDRVILTAHLSTPGAVKTFQLIGLTGGRIDPKLVKRKESKRKGTETSNNDDEKRRLIYVCPCETCQKRRSRWRKPSQPTAQEDKFPSPPCEGEEEKRLSPLASPRLATFAAAKCNDKYAGGTNLGCFVGYRNFREHLKNGYLSGSTEVAVIVCPFESCLISFGKGWSDGDGDGESDSKGSFQDFFQHLLEHHCANVCYERPLPEKMTVGPDMRSPPRPLPSGQGDDSDYRLHSSPLDPNKSEDYENIVKFVDEVLTRRCIRCGAIFHDEASHKTHFC